MALELIETIELTASAASIEFTSIPQDGVDLLLVGSIRITTSTGSQVYVYLNNDSTSANYSMVDLVGNGASVSTFAGTQNLRLPANISTTTANTFGNGTIYISNYTSSNAKSISNDAVTENNATTAFQRIEAYKWSGTSAITSITIDWPFGDMVAGSTASLYKIS